MGCPTCLPTGAPRGSICQRASRATPGGLGRYRPPQQGGGPTTAGAAAVTAADLCPLRWGGRPASYACRPALTSLEPPDCTAPGASGSGWHPVRQGNRQGVPFPSLSAEANPMPAPQCLLCPAMQCWELGWRVGPALPVQVMLPPPHACEEEAVRASFLYLDGWGR